MDQVKWRAVPGFPGTEASSDGKIRRYGIELRQYPKVRGYLGAFVPNERHQRCGGAVRLVHRLILFAFSGAPPTDKHEGAHLNGKRADNRLENLAWLTHSENLAMERGNPALQHQGQHNPNSKLSDVDVQYIRMVHSARKKFHWGGKVLAERFGISPTHIQRIVAGQSWRNQ